MKIRPNVLIICREDEKEESVIKDLTMKRPISALQIPDQCLADHMPAPTCRQVPTCRWVQTYRRAPTCGCNLSASTDVSVSTDVVIYKALIDFSILRSICGSSYIVFLKDVLCSSLFSSFILIFLSSPAAGSRLPTLINCAQCIG